MGKIESRLSWGIAIAIVALVVLACLYMKIKEVLQ